MRQLKQALIANEQVVSAAQQGTHLRVLINEKIANPREWLQREFTDALSGRQLNLVRPSLEDVFVHCTGNRRQ